MKKIVSAAAVLLLLVMTSCATVGLVPAGGSKVSAAEQVKVGVTAFHNGLYVPAMTILGQRLDQGKMSPTTEAKVQKLSEDYVQIKDELGAILNAWNPVTSPRAANDKVQSLLTIIGQLQSLQNGGK